MRRQLVLLSSLVALVLIGFIYNNRFSADQARKERAIDSAVLARSIAKTEKEELPRVKLNATKSDIEKAIRSYRKTPLNNLKKLNPKELEIVNNLEKESKSIDLSKDTSAQTYQIVDSTGAVLSPFSIASSYSTGIAYGGPIDIPISENFDFATNVPDSTKQLFYSAYPKIEAIYGKRSSLDKIKVLAVDQCVYDRSCYQSFTNSILLTPSGLIDNGTVTHELIHAFHGLYCLRPIWEEGMTETTTEILGLNNNLYTTILGNSYELDNNPTRSFNEVLTAQSHDPYAWGSMAFYKVYLDNKDFFKSFNSKLYSLTGTNVYGYSLADPVLINLVNQSTSSIEGESVLDWFSHQFSFIRVGAGGINGGDANVSVGRANGVWRFSLRASQAKTVNIKAFDLNNTLLAECNGDVINMVEWEGDVKPEFCKTFVSNESSMSVRLEATLDNNTANKQITYYPVLSGTDQNITKGLIGIATEKANLAKVTNLDTGWTGNFPVNNGVFIVSADQVKAAGRFRIQLIAVSSGCRWSGLRWFCGSIPVVLKERIVNKNISATSNYNYYTVLLDRKPSCTGFSVSSAALNRSITLSAKGTNYCGMVFRINGIPVERVWGSSGDFLASNLEKATAYNYTVNLGVTYSSSSNLRGTVTTLNLPDLIVTNVENIGDIASGTLKRRYTFNTAISDQSFKNIILNDDIARVSITVQKSADNILDIIPTGKMYYNAQYYIEGINAITDTTGNPIYNYDWEKMGYWFIPMNSLTKIAPTLTPVSNQITVGSSFQLTMNFEPVDFMNHIDLKYKSLYEYIQTAPLNQDGTLPFSEVSVFINRVSECSQNYTEICKKYDLNGDGLTSYSDVNIIVVYAKSKTNMYNELFKYGRFNIFTCSDNGCSDISFNVTVNGDTLNFAFSNPLKAGETYYLQTPRLVDVNNNLVGSNMFIFMAT